MTNTLANGLLPIGSFIRKSAFVILLMAISVTETLAEDPQTAPENKTVKICLGDGSEWAPYTYWARTDKGEVNRDQLVGAATDLIKHVLNTLDYQYSIEYMPWSRVQSEMAAYTVNKRCDMSWDASFKEERFKKYYYSVPLYKTHLGFFYSSKKFATAPPISKTEDLNHFDLCGVIGYNYNRYELTKKITRLKTVSQALLFLNNLRCDFFLSEIETIYGGVEIGAFTLHEGINSQRFPKLFKSFYAIFSKQSPISNALINPFNQILLRLQATGESEQFFMPYLPGGSGL